MVTVNTKKELEAAIKANKSPIVPGNRKMALVLCIVASHFAMKSEDGKRPSTKEIVAYMRGEGIGGQDVAAISEGTLVILVGIAAVTAMYVVSVCRGGTTVITWNPKTKQFELSHNQ